MKLPEPFTYFVDRSLGRLVVVDALREAGETAIVHDDRFAMNTDDAVWLTEAGRLGWSS